MASSSSSSSTTTSAQARKKFDIFISFRGEDTRYSFTSNLRGDLRRHRIQVFDDEEFKRGEEISPSLLNGIEESIISIIVFSEGYASSRWCLEELVKIMECKRAHSQIVIPVFFQVDPSHVRNHQTGTPFGDGFTNLVKSFNKFKLEKLQMTEKEFEGKVQTWSNAMTEAANLSGYTATHKTSQFNLSEKIVKDILKILTRASEFDNKNLIGIERIINYIIEFLLRLDDNKLRNVHIIGIWGMGGLGKTTVAEAVFNRIKWAYFEASYFARNVREKSSSQITLALLQQQLLSTILEDQISNIDSIFTKTRLGRKKVVIVLDDVTSLSQIESLVRDINCFGKGSLIIITTRDKQVLKTCGVDEQDIYNLGGLSPCDALQLFCRHAFGQNCPKADYCEMSDWIVKYSKGVPLALKVLGSSLFDKGKEVWKSAIDRLEIIPHEDIHMVLKVSYDGLHDVEKNIFLDVACFLKWENKDFAKEILDACGFYAEYGISNLIDKCLITIEDNKITMHDLLQEMGWEIVRQESTNDPSERTRLWHHEDIYRIMQKNIGTKATQGICLDMFKLENEIILRRSALAKMHELRFFKLCNSHKEENHINKVRVPQGLNSISIELRYLCWHGCPLKSLQQNFWPRNLVALDMPFSNIDQLWPDAQLHKLKHIDLSYSKQLKTQDLSLAPNLESLILEGCTSLMKISSSINLKKLVMLNLRNCKSLHSLPMGFRLESVRNIILSCCSILKKFDPEISCNIQELFLDETAIEELPASIDNLSRLVTLNLKNCSMLESLPSIYMSKSLELLNVSGCSNIDGLLDNLGNLEAMKELNLTNCCIKELPLNLGQLSSLESLLLGRNNFETIPASIERLSKLSYLDISYCERLQSLPQLPWNLESIDAYNCTSLEASSSETILDVYFWTSLEAFSCGISVQRPISRITGVNLVNCFKLVNQKTFKESVKEFVKAALQRIGFGIGISARIFFPGNEIPDWFIFQSTGSSMIVDLCEMSSCGFIFCAIVEFGNYRNKGQGLAVGFDCIFTSGDKDDTEIGRYHGTWNVWGKGATGPDYVDLDHVFLGYECLSKFPDPDFANMRHYCKVTIDFYVVDLYAKTIDGCKVKKCGLSATFTLSEVPIKRRIKRRREEKLDVEHNSNFCESSFKEDK